MKSIFNIRYGMDIGCGFDVWRICGVVDGQSRMLSSPVEYDQDNDVLKTISGSVYKIESYSINKPEFSEQVTKDIQQGGYETH